MVSHRIPALLSNWENAHAYATYQRELRAAQDPKDDDVESIAGYFGRSKGGMSEYLTIGEALTPTVLAEAGIALDGPDAYETLGRLAMRPMLKIAKLPPANRAKALADLVSRKRGSRVAAGDARSGDAVDSTDGPTAIKRFQIPPARFTVEQLMDRGGCNINLQGAFAKHGAAESLQYLQDVVVTAAALVENVGRTLSGTTSTDTDRAAELRRVVGALAQQAATLAQALDALRHPVGDAT